MNRWTWSLFVAAALPAIPLPAGCGREEARKPPPAVPQVVVVTVQPEKVILSTELPGRISSQLVSEIRPQVNGLIEKRLFTEGADVKAGEVLYQIDPAPFQAALQSATASLDAAKKAADQARAALAVSIAGVARQEATVALAKTDRDRAEDLFKERAVSESDRDRAVTGLDVAEATLRASEAQVARDRAAIAAAEAAVKQAEAAVETCRINLGYARVAAPISGRIGRSNVTEGAIVTAYQALPLATIQDLDPIFVDVPQSIAELNRLKRALEGGRLGRNGTDRVKIILEDGTAYGREGELKFRDVTVDPTTGSVMLRIEVPNPDSVLLPGMFVRAVIEEGVNEEAILVPQEAVSRDSRGNPLALVLDAADTVQLRRLTTDRAVGDRWLVSSGLAKGDRVIIEGLQRVRPGMPARIAEPGKAGAAPAQSARLDAGGNGPKEN